LAKVKGTYGIAAMHVDVPDVIVGARLGSPLVVGLGKGEHFLASDVSALVAHTRDVVYLNDYDIVTLSDGGYTVTSHEGRPASVTISRVDFTEDDADIGEFPHYMLKEIYEQPASLQNALRGRLSRDEATAVLGGLNMTPQELRNVDRIILSGPGPHGSGPPGGGLPGGGPPGGGPPGGSGPPGGGPPGGGPPGGGPPGGGPPGGGWNPGGPY